MNIITFCALEFSSIFFNILYKNKQKKDIKKQSAVSFFNTPSKLKIILC